MLCLPIPTHARPYGQLLDLLHQIVVRRQQRVHLPLVPVVGLGQQRDVLLGGLRKEVGGGGGGLWRGGGGGGERMVGG